jgi:hypothetical protein
MKRKYIKAFNALKKLGVPVYEHADDKGNFSISAEEPDSYKWANYYPEYNQWDGENTNPVMDSELKKHGLYAEWQNPGRLSVYEA